METEKKVIKFIDRSEIEDGDNIRAELEYAMLENKRLKRLVDLFLLALFLLFVSYTLFA